MLIDPSLFLARDNDVARHRLVRSVCHSIYDRNLRDVRCSLVLSLFFFFISAGFLISRVSNG